MAVTKSKKRYTTKKARRAAAANYVKSDGGHWVRRVIKQMKDSPRVQALVTDGKFDRYLKTGASE